MAASDHPVLNYIDKNYQSYVEKLRELARQPSVSAQNLGLEETARLVKWMLEETGFHVELVPLSKGPPVVYATLPSKKKSSRTIVLYNHYDVQPPEPIELWKYPPFSATIEDGKIYARGVTDNKANIVSRMMIAKAFLETQGDVPCNIKWVIEGEEEIGSVHFPEFVSKYRDKLNGQAGIWEFGGLEPNDVPAVTLGLKGMLYVEYKVQTAQKDAHSARAAIIPNPAWRLVKLLDTIVNGDGKILVEGWYDDIRELDTKELDAIRRMPLDEDDIKKELGVKHFLAGLSGFELKKAYLGNPTANIAGVWSGYTGPGHKTVLPSIAQAKMDFRLVPDQDPNKMAKKLRDHINEHGFTDVELTLQAENPAARTPIDSEIARIGAETARETFNREPAVLINSAGSGPMHYWTNALKIPTIAIGVNHAHGNPHAPNENQRIDVFVQGSKWVARVIEEFARAS